MQNNSDRYTESSDISLVELTIIVVRWRRLFLAVFLGLSLATVAYALITPDKQASIGLYQLAKAGDGEYLTDAAAVESTISSVWLPELVLEYESEGRAVPNTKVINPKDTGLIQLQTITPKEQSELAASIHAAVLERLDDWQSSSYKEAVSRVELRLGRHEAAINRMLEESGPGEALAVVMEGKMKLEYQLDRIERGEILTVASRGENGAATSRSLIIVVGLLVAFVMAALLCFMAEFCVVVRKRVTDGV